MPTTRKTAQHDATPYALLGFLSMRPWTTYELAQQVRTSLQRFWPRAERKLYDDPKRLAADGLAKATEEYTGRRKRTVYAITTQGRRELKAWLGTESAEPSWENEALVKVFFADGGDLDALRRTLTEVGQGARGRLAELALAGGDVQFPERRHLDAVTVRLAQEIEEATVRWAAWVLEQAASWNAVDDPGRWDPDSAVYTPLAEAWGEGALT